MMGNIARIARYATAFILLQVTTTTAIAAEQSDSAERPIGTPAGPSASRLQILEGQIDCPGLQVFRVTSLRAGDAKSEVAVLFQ